jgi:hypothetical protein
MNRQCRRRGCENQGVAKPTLLLFFEPDCPPAEARFELWVCEECLPKTGVDSIIDDENWEHLTLSFSQNGLAMPRRELTGIEWEYLA